MGYRQINWHEIELDYCSSTSTIQSVAQKHNVSDSQLRLKAKQLGWKRSGYKDLSIDNESNSRSGFVYVIYITDSSNKKYYKLGIASNFLNRLSSHQTSQPFDVSIAICYYARNMRDEEWLLMDKYKDKKIRGEWFELDNMDLMDISKRAYDNHSV